MSERADNIGQRESLKHIRKRLEAELLSHRDSMRAALPLGGELTDIDCDYILSLALKQLLQAEDGKTASQVAFAVASLGNLALQQQKAVLAGEIANPAKPEKPVKVSTRAKAVDVLWQVVNDKLNTVLSDKKYVTTESVGDIMKCLELVRDMEATLPKIDADKAKHAGLSSTIADRLDEALGLKQ